MEIAIINTLGIMGGAGKAAYRLHKAFQELGHYPFFVTRNKESDINNIIEVELTRNHFRRFNVGLIQKEIINNNRTSVSNTLFTLPYPGIDLTELDFINNADVINLHWIARFLSTETLAKLLSLDKPVVWTLHDMWPFTGGCHYSAGCEKYSIDCYDCPQLRDNKYQIPFYVLKNKLEKIKGQLTLVCLNKWMASCVKQSSLFKSFRVEIIPNALETDIFKPSHKEAAKRNMGIGPDTIVLLFGAISSREKRKGFSLLLNSLEVCMQNTLFAELVDNNKMKIIVFGGTDSELKKVPIPVIATGQIHDDRKLTEIYSASDIFVLPSLEDNLPNTMLESMACGTSVVAFSVGGIPDAVVDNVNGRLASPGDHEDLAAKILDLVFDETKRKKMAEVNRETIEKSYALKIQGQRYLDLFMQLIGDDKKTGSSKKSLPVDGVIKKRASSEVHPYLLKVNKHLRVKMFFRRALSILGYPNRDLSV